MDESWSQTNVKCCAESAVIRYIFSVMYGEIVFVVEFMKIKRRM
jgi:hypothetical protein